MFNLTTSKIIGIVGGVAGVSATGAGIIYLTSGSTKANETATSKTTENKVSHKLTKIGYSPFKIDSELGSTWAGMITKYKQIKETETTLEEIKDDQALKSKCSLALSSEDTEEANYSFAKRFCVKAETIKDMLKSNGYTKLETTVNEGNTAKWQAILDLIKPNEQAQTDIGLVLSGSEDGHLKLLADACKKFEKEDSTTYQDKEFEKHYSLAKEWCSSKGSE